MVTGGDGEIIHNLSYEAYGKATDKLGYPAGSVNIETGGGAGSGVAGFGNGAWGGDSGGGESFGGGAGSSGGRGSVFPQLFAGAYGIRYDAKTNLHYMRYRWYSQTQMRFISLDLIRNANRYSYTNGNPIMYVDPTGLFQEYYPATHLDWYFHIGEFSEYYLPSISHIKKRRRIIHKILNEKHRGFVERRGIKFDFYELPNLILYGEKYGECSTFANEFVYNMYEDDNPERTDYREKLAKALYIEENNIELIYFQVPRLPKPYEWHPFSIYYSGHAMAFIILEFDDFAELYRYESNATIIKYRLKLIKTGSRNELKDYVNSYINKIERDGNSMIELLNEHLKPRKPYMPSAPCTDIIPPSH